MNELLAKERIDASNISIVIPVRDGGENFRKCLRSLDKFVPKSIEIIVVIDGGTDNSRQLATEFGAKVLAFPTSSGPARARNLGAAVATGDILFFIDADVTVGIDTLDRVIDIFTERPDLAAAIGSYDDAPGAANFLSQYKNLFHHYTHQAADPRASTFWGACGAIRRQVFVELGGFDEAYRFPSIEDIELGYRLRQAGYQIRLCKTLQVKHLKRWEAGSLLKAEFFYRAVPWTELLWRDKQAINNDLNLKVSSRLSLMLTFGIILMTISSWWWSSAVIIAGSLGLALILLNLPVYQFFHHKRGFWFALQVIPWHWLYFCYGGLALIFGTARYHLISKNRPSIDNPLA
jgi:GT2 family glycosyltransferase